MTLTRVRWACLLVAVSLGALFFWTGRYSMNADGISYLDMADAYRRGDWDMAVSTVWSPLYSWMLLLSFSILRPGPEWEFPAVQLTNFAIYLAALACFDFLLRQLLHYRAQADSAHRRGRVPLPDWALLAAGYSLFAWSALSLIRSTLVTPHLTVAGLMFLATGLLLSISLRPEAWPAFVLLGGTLGLAYLARTPMVLPAVVMFGLAAFPGLRGARDTAAFARPLAALAVFLVIAGAYAIPLYVVKRRLPLGDFAKVNYAIWVNGLPDHHWQGDPPGSGTPRHPTRRLVVKPAVYEFAEPIGGTYPVWYDPAYWFEGVRPRFDPSGHVRALWRGIKVDAVQDVLSHWLVSVALCVLVGAYARLMGWLGWRDVAGFGSLFVVSIVGLGMFAPVQLIDRYVGGFIPILWLGLLSSVAVTASPKAKRAATGLAVAVLAVHALLLAPGALKRTYETAQEVLGRSRGSTNEQWQVAEGLHQMGLRPGGRVAVLGSGFNAYWARLARVKIVAEIPRNAVDDYWAADDRGRERVMHSLAQTSAEIIVVSPRARPRSVQEQLAAIGWERIGSTDYYAFPLKR